VLVDERGNPKIIDFGVARFTRADEDWTLRTADGQLLGTIPYMSPEQVLGSSGEVGAASDVYAVGVLAFELLTGQLPYEETGLSVVPAITDRDPVRAGSLDARLAGDMEAILGKALEKDPEERYASAAAMAADLRRFLADEPVSVGQPSLAHQLRKLARRNPLFVRAVAAAVAFLVIGLLGSSTGLLAAWNAKRETGEQYDGAKQMALDLVDYYIDELGPQIGSRRSRTEFVTTLAPRIDALLGREPGDPALLAARARVLEARATLAIEVASGDDAEALALLQEALASAQQAYTAAPEDVVAARTLSLIEVRIGDVLSARGDSEDALELYEGVLARDADLASRHPSHERVVDDWIWSVLRVGHSRSRQGDLDGALALFERAHELALDLARWHPEPNRARLTLCGTYTGLINVAIKRDENELARGYADRNLAVGRELVSSDPRNFVYRQYYAGALQVAAQSALRVGDVSAALEYMEEAALERRSLAELHGDDAIEAYVNSLVAIIDAHARSGARDVAEMRARELTDEADRISQRVRNPRLVHWIEGVAWEQLARYTAGTPEGAECVRRSREAFETRCGDDSACQEHLGRPERPLPDPARKEALEKRESSTRELAPDLVEGEGP
jgi:tetratricopeptide (TPR) repeat protein